MKPVVDKAAKAALFVLLAVPFAALTVGAFSDSLGANPVERITHETGEWALRLLLFTLAATPLRRLFGWNWLLRQRRMLGLYTFFYASAHFLTWLWLDQFFDWSAVIEDVIKRPYITVGFSALLLMVPLALTSTRAMVRRLGGQAWRKLHRLVYPAAILAVLHFAWLVKADLTEPLIHGAVLAALLMTRVRWRRTERSGSIST